MTATNELRRMLDERGVEWSAPDSRLHDVKTRWAANGFDYTALEDPNGKAVDLIADYQEGPITPEQAIEATLGRGTCNIRGGECDQCGAYIHRDAVLFWVPVGEGMKTVESRDVNYCPNCGRKVVDA